MENGVEKPVGYGRPAVPPAAAYSHSPSVGKRPLSQMQNASASYHVTREEPASPSQASAARSSVSLTSLVVHAPRQPRPAAPPIAPSSSAGCVRRQQA